MTYRIKFKCVHCGCDNIQSKEVGITQWFIVTAIGTDDDKHPNFKNTVLDFDDVAKKTTDGRIDRFECGKCGFKIASTEIELFNYLKDNNMIEKIK